MGARAKLRSAPEPIALACWMERYIAGDRRAFVALHRAVEPRIRRQLRARIGAARELDDLVQLTFLRAHAGRATYQRRDGDADEALVAWFCAIARNIASNFLRGRQRDRLSFENEVEGVDDFEVHVLERERAAEQRAKVRAALERLPPAQREVVRLHKLEGLPMAEVSRRLGVRDGAVRVRAHRAYENLRSSIVGMAHACGSSRWRDQPVATRRRQISPQRVSSGSPR